MSTYSTPALVLKRTNYGEADRLVTLLTEKHGRVTAIARGVRKPLSKLRGFLELFTYGDFRLAEGKTFQTVVEITAKEYFKNIREDQTKQLLAYGLVEMIVMTLQEHERQSGLLQWAIGWLRSIDQFSIFNFPASPTGRQFSRLFYAGMLLQYLAFIGHAPNLGECGACHQSIQPVEIGWLHEQGGFFHVRCGSKMLGLITLELSTAKLLRFLSHADLKDVAKLQVDQSITVDALRLIKDFFTIQTGRELRIAQQIEGLQKTP